MSILNNLASTQGRKDESPNIELASSIIRESNTNAVNELIEELNNKQKGIANDCIKVLYEIGEQRPDLIAPYLDDFVQLLGNKNNRLQWGAMTAIAKISKIKPKAGYNKLSSLAVAAEKGTVITRDNYIDILIELTTTEMYSNTATDLLLEQLKFAPTNQLPMYAERSLPIFERNQTKQCIDVLTERLAEMEQLSKAKRLEKVIRKLNQ